MNVKQFIDGKAEQLVYFLRAYWDKIIPIEELELYFWDTLEEWAQLSVAETHPYTEKERVFWHVMHQTHYWPPKTLLVDPYLRCELQACLNYLEDEGHCPVDCVGIRP